MTHRDKNLVLLKGRDRNLQPVDQRTYVERRNFGLKNNGPLTLKQYK